MCIPPISSLSSHPSHLIPLISSLSSHPSHLIPLISFLLANIENMECNWGDLPSEVSKDCRQFLQSILCEKLDTRLGTPTSSSSSSSSSAPSSPNTVLRHPFFRPIDFSVLYEARSPYQDIADSFSLGLEGSCYWLDERRAVVPAFEKEELIRSQ